MAKPESFERYVLPNGAAVAHVSAAETDYMYAEIFEDRCYAHDDLVMPADACIFDVGANIGLFSLFALRTWPSARVYAFEPIPDVFERLSANLHAAAAARSFNIGVAAQPAVQRFVYYPRYSMMSGKYADPAKDQAMIRRYVRNRSTELDDPDDATALRQHAEAVLADRFEHAYRFCVVKPLSHLMRELGIERLDLLKLDVEGCELETLSALTAEEWATIRHVVLEVHDDGALRGIRELFARHGFRVEVRQTAAYAETELSIVFALRR